MADTDVEPGAVVVHLEDTPGTGPAVVGPGSWGKGEGCYLVRRVIYFTLQSLTLLTGGQQV